MLNRGNEPVLEREQPGVRFLHFHFHPRSLILFHPMPILPVQVLGKDLTDAIR